MESAAAPYGQAQAPLLSTAELTPPLQAGAAPMAPPAGAAPPPHDLWMACQDGVRLASRVWRPAGRGPWPVLLMRQPYGRAIASTVTYAHPSWYAGHGFLVVVQDVRGRGDSEGEFAGFAQEARDAAAAVRWCRGLEGANGRVGTYGFSYQGLTQLLNAGEPPAKPVLETPDEAPPAQAGNTSRRAAAGPAGWQAGSTAAGPVGEAFQPPAGSTGADPSAQAEPAQAGLSDSAAAAGAAAASAGFPGEEPDPAAADPLPDCLAPAMCGPDERLHWASEGGAHWWDLGLAWALQLAAEGCRRRRDHDGWRMIRRQLQSGAYLEEGLELLQRLDPGGMGLGWLGRDPARPEGWRSHRPGDALLRRPLLLIGGWHDPHLNGVLDLFCRSLAAGGRPRLCIGAWTHLDWRGGIDQLQLAFFQQHLGAGTAGGAAAAGTRQPGGRSGWEAGDRRGGSPPAAAVMQAAAARTQSCLRLEARSGSGSDGGSGAWAIAAAAEQVAGVPGGRRAPQPGGRAAEPCSAPVTGHSAGSVAEQAIGAVVGDGEPEALAAAQPAGTAFQQHCDVDARPAGRAAVQQAAGPVAGQAAGSIAEHAAGTGAEHAIGAADGDGQPELQGVCERVLNGESDHGMAAGRVCDSTAQGSGDPDRQAAHDAGLGGDLEAAGEPTGAPEDPCRPDSGLDHPSLPLAWLAAPSAATRLQCLRSGRWLAEPLPDPRAQAGWGLTTAGLAAVRTDGGSLSPLQQAPGTDAVPAGGSGRLTLVHDPWRPVPSRGGHLGPGPGLVERGDLDRRADVACFQTLPLQTALALIGRPLLRLEAAADQPGFDLWAALSVVEADGRVLQLATGALRLLGEQATERRPRQLALQPLAVDLAAGERLRLSLAAAAWPAIAVNPGDGSLPRGGSGPDHRIISISLDLQASRLWLAPLTGAD